MSNERFDLGFGNAVAVRQAYLQTVSNELIVFTNDKLLDFDYPPYEGDPDLLEITRQVIKRQTGDDYKYIILTNGATGGVVLSLRSYAQQGYDSCWTRRAPWYMRYPSMIKAAGMYHSDEDNKYPAYSKHVKLLDFPSNPMGSVSDMARWRKDDLILDGVYHGRVYSRVIVPLPHHNILVGSYSKLLGLNGIRIGWVATNDEKRYEKLVALATAEYCGLSSASTEILKTQLANFDWQSFETTAQNMLDDNREQISRIERYFGAKVPEVGMFFYGQVEPKCKELLEKASIKYTSGLSLGTSEYFGRLSMGQDRDLTKQAVNAFIKADSIR
jgi:aspartate/methionine/tyrosine aminotransferase